MLKVFVYGTLKPGERNYSIYCKGQVIKTCRAYTYGYLYQLNLGYPAMTVGDNKVKGYLLTFAEETALENLDELEDYHPQRSPQDNQYLRQKLAIYNVTGEPLGEAWSYLMTPDNIQKFRGTFLKSGWWTDKENPRESWEEYQPPDD
ncbi:gamma-glutamylcyclotransferase family protein [Crocosphaera sp. XPORK-15E]|uniref:gamma-glutamylcyclotransferase family protein n=1 Tax=Crocosphaera sp. XPORK-15E TaxID=3110247 RepID=UPI002B21E1CD|nr:gamma-glutamylcyclotransferase [Crocosphaera sp. XPORK-15E]MEA5533026.1 gamma-glutamylcyclotransferase [Crocosphaera sp. XPORK-15E]